MEQIWPNFIYAVISSDLFQESKSREEQLSKFVSLMNLPFQIAFLHFLPLDFAQNQIVPAPNCCSIARITEDAIYALSEETGQHLIKLLRLNGLISVVIVEELPQIPNNYNFNGYEDWKGSWDLLLFSYREGKGTNGSGS